MNAQLWAKSFSAHVLHCPVIWLYRVFMEYYHGWMSMLIRQKLQPLENIITRASYTDLLTPCLPECLHITDVPFSIYREKSSTEHRAEREEQDSLRCLSWQGGASGENFNRISSNYDLHLSFLLKDRCILSPSNLSPLSEFREHL